MKGQVKELIQKGFNSLGLQIRRVDPGVNYVNPYVEQARLLKHQTVKTIVEVGAADGRDSLHYAELFPQARVFAFEPIPSSFEQLATKAKAHGNRVVPCNAAMSDAVGSATFHLAEWPDASSLLSVNKTGSTFDQYNAMRETIQVNTETLDHYCNTHGLESIDVLKMDAQGAELNILKGAKSLLQQRAIKLIYTEVNFLEIYKDSGLYHAIAKHLEDHEFRLHNFYDLVTNQKGELAWGDAIFVRNDLMV